MELRVVELAHAKGLTMADIAKQIGISRVNLSNSLNGNPTLSRLSEVAKILGVEVAELFKGDDKYISNNEMCGCIFFKGEMYTFNDRAELEKLLNYKFNNGK
jgi:transcriptional regulator with XRE-family HTH domain